MTGVPLRLSAQSVLARPMPPEVVAGHEHYGFTSRQAVSTLAARAARTWPHRPALVDADVELDYAQLADLVSRAAGWLLRAGVQPGEVVLWQTPNWWEAHVLALAVWQVGAVSAPVVPVYREHELAQLVDQVRPAAVFAAAHHRGFAHADALDEALSASGLPGVPRVVLRGGRTGWSPVEDLLSFGVPAAPVQRDADDPCLVLFTSGTTSAPKGAVHTSRTLLAETRQLADAWGLSCGDASYMAAPLQHITGLLNAITIPALVGAKSVLAERWDPERAVLDMQRHRTTWTAGATVFLQELTASVHDSGAELALRFFACGGASVPPELLARSEAAGITAGRVYGMTELPTVTISDAQAPLATRAGTDGRIAPGVEVRIRSESGLLSALGSGELLVRGPERMLGYLDDHATSTALDEDGWFATGDLGTVREDGHVLVTGRTKDIINRGGEKFSAREIEDLVASHPTVRSVAIVPAPDARLGEVPVAFVVLEPGQSLSADGLRTHLASRGLARQKTPVAWHVVDSLPATASGKVQKFALLRRLEQQS